MSDSFGDAAGAAMEHAAADAAAGLAGPKGGSSPDTHCRNCGAELAGEFCQHCGQSAKSMRRPFWSLIGEGVETLFSVDGRIARTLPALLIRPGRMTKAYLDGQRARFIPPFRLYVLASLIFFVVLPLVTGQGFNIVPDGAQNFGEARAEIERAYAAGEMTDEEYRGALDGINEVEALWQSGPDAFIPDPPAKPGEEPASQTGEGEWVGFMPKEALDSVRQAGNEGDAEAARFAEVMDNPGRLAEKTQEWIPRLMFVMLPVYACLLALVYLWRRRFFFFDHFIVSLHFHSALFFAMTIGVILSFLIGGGWVTLALLVYSNWYLYRLNRVVYERGVFSSILRVITLDGIYFCILITALTTAVVLGALSI
ncbi:DUF3667 domain-containing protein [Hyphomonas sp. WL0036]|uniref:DUF3667 domain-containing protein n=1 Tax=Hyphomonas sediminis TaxID=2866160 RepID=UPI001C800438|nr:DUF3667 domain-containing protein [Hyphomonas sediminis]MBY9066292.1 DUF3667 domain-containing protein [Hyphomonas sediminis]